jgi:hypothetical protein
MKSFYFHFSLIAFVYFIIWIYLLPLGWEPGDPAIKYFQLIDFVSQKFSSLACVYQGRDIDPSLKYIPLSKSFFLHILDNQCYYVFPFYFTFLLTPFYLLGDTHLVYLLPLISGLYTIWLYFYWAQSFIESQKLKVFFLYSLTASGILVFSITLSEMNLNLAFISTAFYFIWKFYESKKYHYFYLGIFLSGLTVYLRQEALPIGFMLIGFSFLFRKIRFKEALISTSLLFGLLFVWFTVNYLLFQNIMGLRGVQQVQELVHESFFISRSKMILEVLFYGRDNVGLFLAYPVLWAIPFLLKKYLKELDENLKPILWVVLTYLILVPIATITYQGPFWGTRFLLSIVPFLFLISFLMIEKALGALFWRRLIYASLFWAILGVGFNLAVGKYSFSAIKALNQSVDQHAGEVIVLYGTHLESSIISSYPKRKIFSAHEKEDLPELLELLKAKNIQSLSLLYASEFFVHETELFPEEYLSLFKIQESLDLGNVRIKNIILK